ncbi:MAG: ATP-binding protein [Puniceicoccales bacterium]|jgi:predicted AAA+ superfamily ATPase|nr:ATP-binding protein [Puniceicoccales bacterium]
MIPRHLTTVLAKAWQQFPVVVLTGARQVGKTTLARNFLPDARYVTLDNRADAAKAKLTPDAFLAGTAPANPLIVDEVQYAPELFREIKVLLEQNRAAGQFLITGSQGFELMRNVTETLAGRAAILNLTALGLPELPADTATDSFLWRGGFPELWKNPELERELWLGSYITTYLERDVRNLASIGNLNTFDRLLRMLALRVGQQLSYADLARDVGVSPNTAKNWMSILKASRLIFLLEPWHRQRTKRLVKSPKVYFHDSGLLTYLLGFQRVEDVKTNAIWGAVWENLVVSEIQKFFLAAGRRPPLWYWRTTAGDEVDLLVECAPETFLAIESKTAARIPSDALKGINALRKEYGAAAVRKAFVVCRTETAEPLAENATSAAVPLYNTTGEGILQSNDLREMV